jgi:hypothetical protein
MNNTTTSREVNLLEFNPLTQPHHAGVSPGSEGTLAVALPAPLPSVAMVVSLLEPRNLALRANNEA